MKLEAEKNPHTDGEEIPVLKVSRVTSTLKTEDEGPGRDITKKKKENWIEDVEI